MAQTAGHHRVQGGGAWFRTSQSQAVPSHVFSRPAAVPSGFKFADSHEYAKIEGDIATLGITDFAQACGVSRADHLLSREPLSSAWVRPHPRVLH